MSASAAAWLEALRDPAVRAALAEALGLGDLDARVERALDRALSRRTERPETLAEIDGVSAECARKREQRDRDLVALAVGTRRRQRLYRRSEVAEYRRRKAAAK